MKERIISDNDADIKILELCIANMNRYDFKAILTAEFGGNPMLETHIDTYSNTLSKARERLVLRLTDNLTFKRNQP